MLSKIFNVSAYAFLLGLIACSGITEEGNSFANKYDLWNGANGDSQLSLGYWFSVNDNLSSVEFPTVNGNKLSLDDMDLLVSHCGGLCGTVELGESSAPSAGVGIALASNNSAIDISEWDGLCVSYESELLMKGVLHYKDSGTESLDDMPTVNFDKTGNGIKASRCAKWSDFRQTSMNSSSGVDASKKATSPRLKSPLRVSAYRSSRFPVSAYRSR